jgi:hypothetical protein
MKVIGKDIEIIIIIGLIPLLVLLIAEIGM